MNFDTFYQSNRKSYLKSTQSEPIHSHSSENLTSDTNFSHLPNYPTTAHSNVYEYIRSITEDDDNVFLNSPYRTGSHFGFNSPRRNARPLHFHVATATSQYVAIPRSLSIGEMFVNDQILECSDTKVESLMQKTIQQQRSRFWLHPRGWQMPQLGFLNHIETVKNWLMPTNDNEAVDTVQCEISNDGTSGNISSDEEQNTTLTVNVDVHSTMCGIGPENGHCLTPIPEDQDTILSDNGKLIQSINNNDNAKTISLEVINNIMQNLESDKENIDVQPNRDNSNNTFVQKINELNYSTESPNFEFQKQRIEDLANAKNALQRRHMGELNHVLGSPKRQLMGRQERYHRQEEFMSLWEDHLSCNGNTSLPAERPMTASSECSDLSAFDPLEQKILSQIDANALDQFDGIFAKIKNSIIESNINKLNGSLGGTPTPNEIHSSEIPFTRNSSSETIILTPNTSFLQHLEEPVFVPKARNSSTPKSKVAATLNTRKSSSEWPMNRSFDKNQSSPVTLNVSKMRTILKSANKSENTLSAQKPKPPKHRNFIQENIEKAALKKARTISNKSYPKISRSITKPNTMNTPRSNPSAIFALSPFSKLQSTKYINKNCSSNVADCMWMIDRPENTPETTSANSDPLDLADIQTKINGLIAGMSSTSPDSERQHQLYMEQTSNIMKSVDQCSQLLSELRIDRVSTELDEIIELHELMEHELVEEKLLNQAELKEKWVRYNELMFSLSDEDD